MNTNKLPFGVRDCLPGELSARQAVETRIEDTFRTWGGRRIEPPALDYADNFLFPGGADFQSMFKFADSDGSLLVLRPDSTMQIARIAATKLRPEGPLKLYYRLNSYENNSGQSGMRDREFAQEGVELINSPGPKADAEIIALAAGALAAAGLAGFVIEAGHVGYLSALLEKAKVPARVAARLLPLLRAKDERAAERLLQGAGVDGGHARQIAAVAGLFGDLTTLDRAEENAFCPTARQAVRDLRRIVEFVQKEHPGLPVHIDLGNVSGMHYYSGMVFRALAPHYGAPVLEGGRYDNLCGAFGADMPATGFAIGTVRLLEALAAGAVRRQDCITVALAKGRLAAGAVDLLKRCGVDCGHVLEETRKLVLEAENGKYRFIFVKPADVAIYIERGAADFGFVGKDTLLEDERDVYEMLDVGFGRCRMCACGKAGEEAVLDRPSIRVATKYPNIAKRWFFERGQQAEIIKLNGSIELAPILNLSDCIVDIVESGKTLAANNLAVFADLADISSRLIVNKASLKLKAGILPLIRAMREVLGE